MLPGFRGDRLTAARLAAGLTVIDLAAAVGGSESQIRAWETGRTAHPRPPLVPRLAAALGVDPLTLLDVDPADPPLAALRLAAGLSVHDVAAAAGTSSMRYYRLEAGTSEPPAPEVAAAIAAALNTGPTQVEAAAHRARTDRT